MVRGYCFLVQGTDWGDIQVLSASNVHSKMIWMMKRTPRSPTHRYQNSMAIVPIRRLSVSSSSSRLFESSLPDHRSKSFEIVFKFWSIVASVVEKEYQSMAFEMSTVCHAQFALLGLHISLLTVRCF